MRQRLRRFLFWLLDLEIKEVVIGENEDARCHAIIQLKDPEPMNILLQKYRAAFKALGDIATTTPDLKTAEACTAAMRACIDLGDENERPEAHMLLRSAHEIALRNGEETNWDAFRRSVRKELFEQAGIADLNDEQTVLRVTCTARTYRAIESGSPEPEDAR